MHFQVEYQNKILVSLQVKIASSTKMEIIINISAGFM